MTKRTDKTAPRLDGNTWIFPDGRTLPVVGGGDETAGDKPETDPAPEAEATTDQADEPVELDIPEDLTSEEVTDAQLAEWENLLVAEFDARLDEGSTDVEEMSLLADEITRVRKESGRRVEETEKARQKIADLASVVRPAEEEETDPADQPDPDASTDDAPQGGETVETDPADQPEDDKVPAGATASNKPARAPSVRPTVTRRPASASAMRQTRGGGDVPASNAEISERLVITASADVPGYASSQEMTIEDVAIAFHKRAARLSNGSAPASVASISIPVPEERRLQGSQSDQQAILEAATSPQNLVAAGGWCAPNDTMWELFNISSGVENILSLPTVGISRGGGINVPSFYDPVDAAEDGLWTWTEADDIAALDNNGDPLTDTVKPCVRIPCPTFNDYTLEIEGLCVTHGNLMDRAWPELTSGFVRLVVDMHLRRLSAAKIAKILTDVGAAVPVGSIGSDLVGDLLSVVELQAADFRSRYRMAESAVLEVVFPTWTHAVVRASLAARAGVDFLNVTNEMINGWFAARRVAAQFVSDWQPLNSGGVTTAWPTELDFLIYPAGGYFEGTGFSLDLGVVRDSTLNATNDFTAAWSEQAYLVGKRGPSGRRIRVDISTFGTTACCPVPESEPVT